MGSMDTKLSTKDFDIKWIVDNDSASDSNKVAQKNG